MTVKNDKERTVAFFEIVSKDNQRMKQLPWARLLGKMSCAPIKDRTHTGLKRTLVGQVVTYQETDHLLLGKVKDADEWIEQVNFDDGSIEQFDQAENRGLLETSVVCFLSYGNVLGMIRGSTSAPGCSALEEWINGLELVEDPLKVRAIVSKGAMDKIKRADGARLMELRVGASKAAAVADSGKRLGRTINALRQEYGDARITITVEVSKENAYRSARHELLDDVMELAEMTDVAERATAKLTYWDQSEDEKAEHVNLMKEHITAKKRIPSRDETGQLIRNSSAVAAIMGVAADHERELRLAVDAVRG
ncbi:hypothetical protein [Streptosporangium sp. NPDC023615]|uniref:hypothetical protein n=1 Tax=Streptosporangium sp. NPDC023615 TaxID=3154794 RepID=UPI003416CC9A